MGRKHITADDDPRWVFNRLAEDYRARPPYPDELIASLRDLAAGAGRRAVDLGAGTGHVAVPLAAAGVQVIAVEPAREMLRVLRERAGEGAPGGGALENVLRLVHATAESTGLESGCADLVVLADALHWVDADAAGAEAARLLRSGGVLAVVEARFAATPFMRAVSAAIEEANFKARPGERDLRRERLFAAAGAVDAGALVYRTADPLEPAQLDAVLRSLSLVGPALGPEALAALLAGVRRTAEACGGATWGRDLTLTWGRAR